MRTICEIWRESCAESNLDSRPLDCHENPTDLQGLQTNLAMTKKADSWIILRKSTIRLAMTNLFRFVLTILTHTFRFALCHLLFALRYTQKKIARNPPFQMPRPALMPRLVFLTSPCKTSSNRHLRL